MSYRASPAVLPSLRDFRVVEEAPGVCVVTDDPAHAEACERAASAPCPEASPWRFDGPVPPWLPPPPPARVYHPPFNAAGA